MSMCSHSPEGDSHPGAGIASSFQLEPDGECSQGVKPGAVTSVVLIDDHPVIAAGLRLAFATSGQFILVGNAANPADGLVKLEGHRPDVVVLDLVFEGIPRIDLARLSRAILPAATIVVFSSLPEARHGPQALASGADAYLSKSEDLSALLDLIGRLRSNAASRPAASGSALVTATGHRATIEGVPLTTREFEVARLVAQGLSIDAIADSLRISTNTAAVHRDNLRKKLRCRDTKELTARLARIDALGPYA